MKRAGIGVVGAGRWGRNLIRVFGSLERCRIVAVCDTDLEKLLGAPLPCAGRQTRDFSDLIDDPAITAVVIATPPRMHAAQAIRALEAGKHVFVEKPMALCLRDAKRMRDAALATHRHLMVGHLLRYHPGLRALERLVRDGVLGHVRRIVALRLGPRTATSAEGPWWSLAPHDVSLVRHLLGSEVVAVSARSRVFADGTSTIGARLRLAGGSAWLVASSAAHRKTRCVVALGDQAAAIFDDGAEKPTLRVLPTWDALSAIHASIESRNSTFPLGNARHQPGTSIVLPDEEPLRCEAIHFVDAVVEGTRIETDAEEGCSVTAALEAGSTSISRAGRWIGVATTSESLATVEERGLPL